jgi:hypothetical protein
LLSSSSVWSSLAHYLRPYAVIRFLLPLFPEYLEGVFSDVRRS